MNNHYYQVLLPKAVPIELIYCYHTTIEIGAVVTVPLGRRTETGVVWKIKDKEEITFNVSKIKPIKNIIVEGLITPSHQALIERTASHYLSDTGNVLKMAIGNGGYLEYHAPKVQTLVKGVSLPARITQARQQVLDFVESHPGCEKKVVIEHTGVSASVITSLIKMDALSVIEKEEEKKEVSLDITAKPELSFTQEDAAYQLVKRIDTGLFCVCVLDGVTGSGKTEVYFEAIEHVLCKDERAQILVMLPEIILTTQLVSRFEKRFGFAPTQWHSGLTIAVRKRNYHDIVSGQARIIIGARSALYLPYKCLSLIVVDEEHDSSYKQEDGVPYHGRDMAVMRGFLEKLTVILASATPSLETVYNVREGKYDKITLPSRFGAVMPDIDVVDMKKAQKHDQFLSLELCEQINARLERSEQSLLFLNRRGFAPLTLCRSCGFRFQCSSCSSWMVRHEAPARLDCHLCGQSQPVPNQCPSCQSQEGFAACGPGVQRIAQTIEKLWPSAKITLMDSDHLANESTRKEMITSIIDGHADIIVGTQIIAKGHHFPKLSFVGIVDADIGLSGGDLRAAEKCYQLLQQVSGRAGREHIKGQVMIQSYMPDNSVIQALASGDRDLFVESELMAREICSMPPYSRLISIMVSSLNATEAERFAQQLVKKLPVDKKIDVLGPVMASIFVVRKRYRYRLLIRSETSVNIQKWVANVFECIQVPKSVQIKLDVDPQNFG